MTSKKITSFKNYNFTPFNKKQCIQRLIFMWIYGIAICLLSTPFYAWLSFVIAGNISVSIFFIFLIAKKSKEKISRFWCDGICYLYNAFLTYLLSYFFITLDRTNDWLLFIILMCMFILVFIAILISICSNIEKDRYNSKNDISPLSKLSIFSLLGASFAMFIMRIISHYLSPNSTIVLISALCLLLAVILELGGGTILRALL